MATGVCERRCFDRVWASAAVDAFRVVKDAFDPERILNPGVKVPLPNERSCSGEEIKYGPDAVRLFRHEARGDMRRRCHERRPRLFRVLDSELLDET